MPVGARIYCHYLLVRTLQLYPQPWINPQALLNMVINAATHGIA
jgi:hypothetical protein